MSPRSLKALVATVGLLALICCRTAAAVEVKITEAKATPHSEIKARKAINGVETGLLQMLTPADGKIFVHVRFVLQVEWDEATDSVNYDAKNFGISEGDTLAPYRGLLDTVGEMYFQDTPNFGAYRPFDWEEKKQPGTQEGNGFWEVSKSAKSLTLKIGDQTARIDLQGEPQLYEVPLEFGMEVAGTKLHESLTRNIGFDTKFPVQLTNEGGSILEVRVKVTPKFKSKDTEAGQRKWGELSSLRYYLSFGKGGRAVAVGHLDASKELMDAGSIYFFAEDPMKPQILTLFFPAPSNLKNFNLHYHGHQVAQGTVGK